MNTARHPAMIRTIRRSMVYLLFHLIPSVPHYAVIITIEGQEKIGDRIQRNTCQNQRPVHMHHIAEVMLQ